MNSDAAQSQSAAGPSEFDEFADNYDAALEQGIGVTGESKEYFAENRILWLKQKLDRLGFSPSRVLDFGCGTATATPYLLDILGAQSLVGVDVSARSIDLARRTYADPRASFFTTDQYQSKGQIDLAFCNGVFHHIPLSERKAAVKYVLDAVRPGGLFAFWENNPLNPGTRYVMKRCPFDRDAITLTPSAARRLLREGGWNILDTSYRFIFPRFLSVLRPLERAFAGMPVGGQYQVLCQSPATASAVGT